MLDKIFLAKKLLAWNQEYLTKDSPLRKEDIATCFAKEFTVRANGREYFANHDSYFDFLNSFRATIDSITYEVHEYLETPESIILPMTATIVRINGEKEMFEAMLWLQFNDEGLVTLWHEVYLKIL